MLELGQVEDQNSEKRSSIRRARFLISIRIKTKSRPEAAGSR